MQRTETRFKKYITTEEVEALINAVEGLNYKTLFQVLRYTGMRVGDACALRKDAIDWQKNIITICMEKTKKVLVIPLNSKLKAILLEYLANYPLVQTNPYIFQTRNLSPVGHIKTNSARWEMFKARNKTGLADTFNITKRGQNQMRCCCHVFRHYYATQIYNHSDLFTASQMLGHKDISTTAKYYIDDVKMDKKKALSELVN